MSVCKLLWLVLLPLCVACSSSNTSSDATSSSSGALTGSTVGQACTAGSCGAGFRCDTSQPGGVCTKACLGLEDCPQGSTCRAQPGGTLACEVSCAQDVQCRVAEGYRCDTTRQTCVHGGGALSSSSGGSGPSSSRDGSSGAVPSSGGAVSSSAGAVSSSGGVVSSSSVLSSSTSRPRGALLEEVITNNAFAHDAAPGLVALNQGRLAFVLDRFNDQGSSRLGVVDLGAGGNVMDVFAGAFAVSDSYSIRSVVPLGTGFLVAASFKRVGQADAVRVDVLHAGGPSGLRFQVPMEWSEQPLVRAQVRVLSETALLSPNPVLSRVTASGAVQLAAAIPLATGPTRNGAAAAVVANGGNLDIHRVTESADTILTVPTPAGNAVTRVDQAGDLTLLVQDGVFSPDPLRIYRGTTVVAAGEVDNVRGALLVGDGTQDVILVSVDTSGVYRVRRMASDFTTVVWGDIFVPDGSSLNLDFVTLGLAADSRVAVVMKRNGVPTDQFVVRVYAP